MAALSNTLSMTMGVNFLAGLASTESLVSASLARAMDEDKRRCGPSFLAETTEAARSASDRIIFMVSDVDVDFRKK